MKMDSELLFYERAQMENIENIVGKLEAKLDSAEKERQKLHNAIFGNGREGIVGRTTRIEGKVDSMKERVESVMETVSDTNTSVGQLKASIDSLKDMMEDHLRDETKHSAGGMIRAIPTKQLVFIAGTMVLVWIFLHSVIPDSVVFWDIISKWLGL